MKNKISIIIPAYNVEQYIQQCIESINSQTYKNFEVIIVNDGSTDNTLNIIQECKRKYNWIEIIDIDNHGQGYARNMALEKAKGEYIFFFDADDFIEPLTLELAIRKIEEDNSDLVVFDWKYYYQETSEYKYANKDELFSKSILEAKECTELLKIKHYFTVNKLYRKSFLLNNDIKYAEGHLYEDNPFWVNVAVSAKKVSFTVSEKKDTAADTKLVVETNIDDMNPQNYEYVLERLFAVGAVDAYLTPIIMKKNRPAIKISVLVDAKYFEEVSRVLFEETTTIGIRYYPVERKVAVREFKDITTELGTAQVKISSVDGTVTNVMPEYEDCKKIARETGVPLKRVRECIREAAMKQK